MKHSTHFLFYRTDFRQQEDECLRKQYIQLLHSSNSTPLAEKMINLRKMVIDHGLPEETTEEKETFATKCSLRC